jgi:glycogen(starch) synthase
VRVLHLTTEFPPVIYGGLGTAVGGWVTASARAGLEVGVQLVEGPLILDASAYGYGGFRSSTVPRAASVSRPSGVTFFQCSWADAVALGIGLVREWRPDVVHLHTAMLWYVAEALQAETAVPIVYHVHSVDRAEYEIGEEPNPWLAHSQAQERAIERADRLIALTRSEADLLIRYYPLARYKVRVAGNGIEDSAAAREAAFHRLQQASLLVLYSGRMVERKGVRELLAVLPDLLSSRPEVSVAFVGGPPPLTGPEVAAQWLGKEHSPFAKRIHFTGWQPPASVANWYAAADILVVPSRYEPFGMVILEGMLHGLAVLASDVGGPSEIIDHGKTGLLFPARDVRALHAALSWLITNSAARRQIGLSAAQDVRDRWLWAKKAAEILPIYRELFPKRTAVDWIDGASGWGTF